MKTGSRAAVRPRTEALLLNSVRNIKDVKEEPQQARGLVKELFTAPDD